MEAGAPKEGQELADAVAAGRAVIHCQAPAIDEGAAIDASAIVLGWAWSPAGIESVELTIDGVVKLPLRRGLYRPDVARLLDVDSTALGFAEYIDTSGWAPGEHAVSVAAIDGRGRVARHAGSVSAGRDEPYRAWRRRTGGFAREGRSARPGGLVHEDGSDLRPALRRIAARHSGHVLIAGTNGELAPRARGRVAGAFRGRPPPDLVYADEDAIVADGRRGADYLKPGWSPELLLSTDYVGPLVGVGPRAARAALDSDPGPLTTIYELMLLVVDAGLRVERIPEVLFTSAAPRRPADEGRVREAIEALGARRGLRPRIEDTGRPGARHAGWELRGEPCVSIVIPTAYTGRMLDRCLASVRERSTYSNLEVVLVDSSAGALPADLPALRGVEHSIVACEGAFNYSRACNLGAAAATGDYLLFANDDVEVTTADWIERLLEHAQIDGVGPVGAKLTYPDGTIQHAGVNLAPIAGGAAHMFALLPGCAGGYQGLLGLTRNCTAVTAACVMIDAGLFGELDGFEESLVMEFGDVDLCVRATEAGRRVVWTPRAELIHHEAASRGMGSHAADAERFMARWRDRFADGDPLYHPAFLIYPSFEYQTPVSAKVSERVHASPAEGAGERPSPERFVPEGEGRARLVEAEHQTRYRWAAQVAGGRQVLDAGCGAGYGSAVLAAAGALGVIGIDVSPEAVEAAAREHGAAAEFRAADLEDLPFEDASFDLVTCFEAIEHVADSDRALDELRRVLRPGGLLLISSPNRGVYLPGNPWHVHEFRPEELRDSLGARFANVALYRQQANLASSITDDSGFTTDDPGVVVVGGVRRVVAGEPGRELYTVAAASDHALPELEGAVVITNLFDLAALWELAFDASHRAWEAEADSDALRDSLEQLKRSPSWRITAPLRGLKRALRRPRARRRT